MNPDTKSRPSLPRRSNDISRMCTVDRFLSKYLKFSGFGGRYTNDMKKINKIFLVILVYNTSAKNIKLTLSVGISTLFS